MEPAADPPGESRFPDQGSRRRRIAWVVLCTFGATAIVLTLSPAWFGEVRHYAAGGTVIYVGEPVGDATVTFIPLDHDGPMSAGTTDRRGRFTLSTSRRPGLPAGRYRVAIRAVDEENTPRADFSDPNLSHEEKKRIMISMMESEPQLANFRVPQQYANPFTSGFTAEVTSDENQNEFRFDLN